MELGKWACEAEFTKAKFIRSKTYIEEIDGELKITVDPETGDLKIGNKAR